MINLADEELIPTPTDSEELSSYSEVDSNLYLSREFNDKDINDCFSMLLSIRNILILILLILTVRFVHNLMTKIFVRLYK